MHEAPSIDATALGQPVEYRWRYDADYYRTVIERYYRQLPFILHLPTQFTMVWLLGVGVSWVSIQNSPIEFAIWALLGGVIGIPAGTLLTKKAILYKYRLRPSFGSDARYWMSATGITLHQKSLHGSYPWSAYSRAVRFHDGLLLLQRGGIRCLPDNAIQSGTVEAAMALVSAHLPMRLID